MMIFLVSMATSTLIAVLLERIAYRPLRTAPAWFRSSLPSGPHSFYNTHFGGSMVQVFRLIRGEILEGEWMIGEFRVLKFRQW